jgi:hypothetical protein
MIRIVAASPAPHIPAQMGAFLNGQGGKVAFGVAIIVALWYLLSLGRGRT